MKETLENNTTNSNKVSENSDFSENQYYENIQEIEQSKQNEKIESDKLIIKQKLLLELSDFWITENDFELINKDNTIIIISNSSYFSSIVWLNGIQEKENTRIRKNRVKYDNLDKFAKKLYESNLTKEGFIKKLKEHCTEKNLNYDSIYSWWECIISVWNTSTVGLKRFLRDTWDLIEKNKWTIIHESQHIKFNTYCKENWITPNWVLKLLDEVLAHCTNTKTEDWDIDFEKIFDTMKNNENYIKISWIKNKEKYISTIYALIWETEKELNNNSNNLDTTMIKLINEHNI